MKQRVFLWVVMLAALAGCSSDRDSLPLVQGSNGVASISGDAVVGGTLSASVTDPDGVQSGSESYQWYSNGELIPGATSINYTLTQNEGGESVTVVIRFTDDTGLRETVTSTGVDIQAAFALGALYVHGLVDGATCGIAPVDEMGAAASPVASGTSSDGSVDFGDLVPVNGPALISCSGGTYVDEATGAVLDAPDTRAVVNVMGNSFFTVSPLTEIATQLAETAGDLNTALSTHNERVGFSFGVFADITIIVPTDLTTTAAEDDDPGRYATALALISQVDDNDPDASAGETIARLSTDLEDGTFSQDTLDEFNQAVVDIAGSPIAGNLNAGALDTVQKAINNEPEPAEFEGLSATIPNDQQEALTGTIIVSDVNFDEDRLVAQTDAQTTYGVFTVDENGAWTYLLDTSDPTVAGLEIGDAVNDVILISSVDGTPANLVIRITALTQVAEIRNLTGGDTGELRLNLDPHQLEGRLSFSFLKTEALADDGNQKDAYITLYGSSGRNSESLVDLRIQGTATEDDGSTREPRFLVRNTDNAAYPGGIIEAPFTPNEWYDIEIIWDMSQANQVTILINGEALGGGPFSTAAVVDPDFTTLDEWFGEGVERVQWRFGDDGSIIPFGSYFVDNVVIYSDTAGTTSVFEDDFEGYDVGYTLPSVESPYNLSIDTAVAVFDVSGEPENTPAAFFDLTAAMSSDDTDPLTGTVTILDPDPGEALLVTQMPTATQYGTFSIVESGDWEYTLDTMNPDIVALPAGESVVDAIQIASVDGSTADIEITIRAPVEIPSGLQAAVIRDTDPTDAGELRYDIAPQLSGRLEVTYDRTVTGPDAFIALLNSSGSTSSERSIVDMRIRDDAFEFRDQTFTIAPGVVPTPGTLQTVVITWSAQDAVTPPTVTVTVDGENVIDVGGSFTSGANALGGVERVQFRFGSGSATTDFADTFTIERWEVFSDTAGTTSVFADDFSTYTVGNSLDPNAVAVPPATEPPTIEPGTPYSSSSSEVVVESLGGDPVGAVIRDTDPTDTGELRYDITAQLSGRLEVTYDRTVTGPDAFIALLNSSGSTSSERSIVDMRIKDDAFEFRDQSFVIAPGVAPTPGTLQTVVITWTAPDAATPPTVTVTVDGVNVIDGSGSFTSGANALGGVERVQFRFGSGSGVTDLADTFTIERWEVFSDTVGTASVFADDFTGYTIGNSLDPNAVAVPPATEPPTIEPGTPYSSSSSEVVVESLVPTIAAVIRDTDPTDTGELRYDITAQLSGRLEVTYDRTVTGPDAFIALLNSSGSTSSERSIIDMRIRDDAFEFRDQTFTIAAGVAPVPGTLQTVVITWTAPDAATPPTVTVTVDGINVVDGGGSFTSGVNALGGVERVQFRFGSTSASTDFTDTFMIERWEVFSDTAGTTSVFADDFTSYTLGNSLDPNAVVVPPATEPPTIEPGTPYSSSSSEVTVESIGGP